MLLLFSVLRRRVLIMILAIVLPLSMILLIFFVMELMLYLACVRQLYCLPAWRWRREDESGDGTGLRGHLRDTVERAFCVKLTQRNTAPAAGARVWLAAMSPLTYSGDRSPPTLTSNLFAILRLRCRRIGRIFSMLASGLYRRACPDRRLLLLVNDILTITLVINAWSNHQRECLQLNNLYRGKPNVKTRQRLIGAFLFNVTTTINIKL